MKITIPTDAGPIQLEGRLAAAVAFMVEHQREIQSIPCGRIVLHFKGKSVVPELSRSYRSLHDDEPAPKG